LLKVAYSFTSQFSYRQYRVFKARYNHDQQAKDTLFRNRPQCFPLPISTAGTTGMNMSVENNMLHYILATLQYILAYLFSRRFSSDTHQEKIVKIKKSN